MHIPVINEIYLDYGTCAYNPEENPEFVVYL